MKRALPERERARIVTETLTDARELGDHLVYRVSVAGFGDRQRRRQVVGCFSVRIFRRRVPPGSAQIDHGLRGESPGVATRIVKRELARVAECLLPVQRLERLRDRTMERARARKAKLGV